MIELNSHAAERFLTTVFGETPDHKVLLSFQRSHTNATMAAAGKKEVVNKAYSCPEKCISASMWQSRAQEYNTYYCTSLIHGQQGAHNTYNAASLSMVWMDIDAMRELDIDTEEFFQEIKDSPIYDQASIWVRTSVNGLQGIYLLDQPITFDPGFEDDDNASLDEMDEEELELALSSPRKADKRIDPAKAAFIRDELKPMLWQICYFFGGDTNVINLSRLLRLPGSLNIKYSQPFRVKAHYPNREEPPKRFEMAKLRKQFKVSETTVPLLAFHAISKLMGKHCRPGNNHYPLMMLWGSVRRMGFDKETCLELCKKLCKWFNTNDDESSAVESTYEREFSEVVTLRGELNGYTCDDIADQVEKVLRWWLKLKERYCKAFGIQWSPVGRNPIQDDMPDEGVLFKEQADGMYWRNPKNDMGLEKVTNFSIHSLYTLVRPANGSLPTKKIDVCELLFQGDREVFEWPAEKDTDWTKFKTVTNLPPKLSFLRKDLWSVYIDWLSEQKTNRYLIESPQFGVLDADTKPTVLLPNRPHPKYAMAKTGFTTVDGQTPFERKEDDLCVEYLNMLSECYPTYHDPSFLWPALGWFVASPFTAFSRQLHNGFPVLMVSGLAESGKTNLITHVLARHLGCQEAQNFLSSTLHIRRKKLASNNIIPLIVDEFRDVDEIKTTAFLDIIRNLWDGSQREAGSQDGGTSSDKQIGCMCVIGEHNYQDEATLHRTFAIRVKPTYLQNLRDMSDRKRDVLREREVRLQDAKYKGVLGYMILQWMEENMDRIYPMMEKAKLLIEKRWPDLKKLRNIIGMSLVVFGFMVLKAVYKKYGVEFPFDMEELIGAVFAASPEINTDENYGGANIATLFHETDHIIMESIRTSRTLRGVIFVYDLDDRNIAYFDINRWFRCISPRMRHSQSATLINRTAFTDLLKASKKNTVTPVLGFPKHHAVFPEGSCVKIDLGIVREEYGIAVDQWALDDNYDRLQEG